MCTCYAGGLLVFLLWPVAGPYLVYPTSISTIFASVGSYEIMRASLAEFSSIRLGGQPISGFGYFVGFPSLHVALAIVMQDTV